MKGDELTEKEDDGELEKGSDSDIIRGLLDDEGKGLDALTQALANATDPQLKQILEAIQEDEQKHNAALEQYLKENDPDALDEHEDDEGADDEDTEADEAVESGMADTEKDEDGGKSSLIDDIRAVLGEHGDGDLGKEDDEEDEDDDDGAEKACSKSYWVPIRKADQQIVYGVVSEPDTIDLQGDRLSESEIRKACHKFMMESQKIGKEHDGPAKADIIESYIAPTAFRCNGQVVKAGSWVMAVKIHDPKLWRDVKKGDITGFSIHGRGNRTPL